jgi:RimJ/RimL family protein N-acetyltransferase
VTHTNRFGQPIGPPLDGWTAPPFPPRQVLEGSHAMLEPLDRLHIDGLWSALSIAPDSLWTYMTAGPFTSRAVLADWVDSLIGDHALVPFAVIVDGAPLGLLTYLRIDPPAGCVEIGSIVYSPALQRTTAATETIHLMIANAIDLGYRRVEWKCDDLNAPSRAAAVRHGFTYEGTFRQATHYKGRNRDTAWFAITDAEWPKIDRAFRAWLSPENFTAGGAQQRTLRELRSSPPG